MKPKPKTFTKAVEKRLEFLDTHCPFRTCYVCDREARDLQMITPTRYRCVNCHPGSHNWVEYFERLKPRNRTEAGQIIYNHAVGRNTHA